MTNTFDNEKTGLFKSECKIINLKYEYEGYTGKEKWAISTALSEEEMLRKYADIINRYVPYVFLSETQGAAIIEYQNNEAKYRMRNLRYGCAFDINDGEFYEHHPELAVSPDIVEEIMLEDNIQTLRKAITNLKEVQKRRIIKYFFFGKTHSQIADEEGVSSAAIKESIKAAIKRIKKFSQNTLPFSSPSSNK